MSATITLSHSHRHPSSLRKTIFLPEIMEFPGQPSVPAIYTACKDDGCDAFFWKDKVSREHPPSESNSTPERDSRDLARMIEGIKEALEAQNQIIRASIEHEKLRTTYLYKIHDLFVAICCVLVAMCCIFVYMVFRV
eukprot:TRINITY_DN16950_c0_g1_i15.p2 TRINITY_DN16950_c0_g1~~TRINITY_DN16950_c0_g1_i15.p2  ORF type:complete len:137 (+),score=18.22 TRINITY_DN16950_c0_g1_i15:868-1278(+)